MNLPQTLVSQFLDPFVETIGRAVSWIWLVLMGVIVFNVCARYLFGQGRIEFEEIQWHLYSVGFLLALGYGVTTDSHIRVDVLHERFSERVQVWIDLYGLILLVMPFVLLMLIYGVPFVVDSYNRSEVSASPGGLPLRWIIKSVLVIGFGILALATVSRLSRLAAYLAQDAR